MYDVNFIYEMGYNKGFKDGIKGSITKEQYEARLKADLEAILKELQLEIEETKIDLPFGFEPINKTEAFYEGISASTKIIQEKINALEGECNESDLSDK